MRNEVLLVSVEEGTLSIEQVVHHPHKFSRSIWLLTPEDLLVAKVSVFDLLSVFIFIMAENFKKPLRI